MAQGNERLNAPYWRHDGYTLRKLRASIEALTRTFLDQPSSQQSSRTQCVVDLGAGSAPYRSLFTERGCTYTTCDLPDPNAATQAADVMMASGSPVPLDEGVADFVVSFQVLEHVWDLDWYLGEARRLLKPGAPMLLSTHGTWLYHPHPTDFRRWTRDGLIREIEERGFRVTDVRADVGPLAWTTQFRTLAYHHAASHVPLVGSLISAAICSFMYFRMVLEDWVTSDELIESNAAVYTVLATRV